jgi:hypothetical protein
VLSGIYYEPSKRSGQHLLVFNGIRYFRNRKRGSKQYWKCSFYYKTKCPAIIIVDVENDCYETQHDHQHDPALAPPKKDSNSSEVFEIAATE